MKASAAMPHFRKLLQNDTLLPWVLALAGMLVLGLLLPVNPVPGNDTATRYMPMARAFADGLWDYAFHPYYGILFSLLGGTLHLLPGVDAFTACQLAALLLWGLAAIPLYHVALIVWDRRSTAVICELLYLGCSHLHRFIYDGMRDNGRSLGFFLTLWGLMLFWKHRESWKALLPTTCGTALLMMVRGDCVLFSLLGILVFLGFDLTRHRWRCWRSGVLVMLTAVLLAPQFHLNYRWSGYPVPTTRFAILLQQLGVPPPGGRQ